HHLLHSFPTRRSSDLGVSFGVSPFGGSGTVDGSKFIIRSLAITSSPPSRIGSSSPPEFPSSVVSSASPKSVESSASSGVSRDSRSEEHTSELQSRENL